MGKYIRIGIFFFTTFLILTSLSVYAADLGLWQGLERATNPSRILDSYQKMEEIRQIQEQTRQLQEQTRMIEQQRLMMQDEQRRLEQQRQATIEEPRLTANPAIVWYQKALALWVDGKLTNPERAIEYLTEAIRLKPDFWSAYNDRGAAYILGGYIAAGCRSAIRACEYGVCNAYEYFKQTGDCR